MTPAPPAAHRTLCPTCRHRAVARRIDHPSGVVLRCPLCGAIHARHRDRRLSAV